MQAESAEVSGPKTIKLTAAGKIPKKRGRKPKPKVDKPIKIRKKPGPKPKRKERFSLLGNGRKLDTSSSLGLLATKLTNLIKVSYTTCSEDS